jgi:transposase
MPPEEGGDSSKLYWPFARWTYDQGLSSGLTRWIHARTNAQGLGIGFSLTPGQASDMMSYDTLIAETAPDPLIMLADKGYDSDAIRADLIQRGVDPVIPTRSNRKIQLTVDKKKYAMRNLIERFFNKLKHPRRVATRYDKLASSFIGFVQLATIRIWIRFVNSP